MNKNFKKYNPLGNTSSAVPIFQVGSSWMNMFNSMNNNWNSFKSDPYGKQGYVDSLVSNNNNIAKKGTVTDPSIKWKETNDRFHAWGIKNGYNENDLKTPDHYTKPNPNFSYTNAARTKFDAQDIPDVPWEPTPSETVTGNIAESLGGIFSLKKAQTEYDSKPNQMPTMNFGNNQGYMAQAGGAPYIMQSKGAPGVEIPDKNPYYYELTDDIIRDIQSGLIGKNGKIVGGENRDFNANARNKNKNGSEDIGPLQINSNTFKDFQNRHGKELKRLGINNFNELTDYQKSKDFAGLIFKERLKMGQNPHNQWSASTYNDENLAKIHIDHYRNKHKENKAGKKPIPFTTDPSLKLTTQVSPVENTSNQNNDIITQAYASQQSEIQPEFNNQLLATASQPEQNAAEQVEEPYVQGDNPFINEGNRKFFDEWGSNSVPGYKSGGIPSSPMGLYEYPNQPVNVPTPDGSITMNGIGSPVLAIPNNNKPQMMYPNKNYNFNKSNSVLEIPMAQSGISPQKAYYNDLINEKLNLDEYYYDKLAKNGMIDMNVPGNQLTHKLMGMGKNEGMVNKLYNMKDLPVMKKLLAAKGSQAAIVGILDEVNQKGLIDGLGDVGKYKPIINKLKTETGITTDEIMDGLKAGGLNFVKRAMIKKFAMQNGGYTNNNNNNNMIHKIPIAQAGMMLNRYPRKMQSTGADSGIGVQLRKLSLGAEGISRLRFDQSSMIPTLKTKDEIIEEAESKMMPVPGGIDTIMDKNSFKKFISDMKNSIGLGKGKESNGKNSTAPAANRSMVKQSDTSESKKAYNINDAMKIAADKITRNQFDANMSKQRSTLNSIPNESERISQLDLNRGSSQMDIDPNKIANASNYNINPSTPPPTAPTAYDGQAVDLTNTAKNIAGKGKGYDANVATIQQMLKNQGRDITVNGIRDANTEKLLMDYNGHTIDKLVNDTSGRRVGNSNSSNSNSFKQTGVAADFGMDDATIKNLQRQLGVTVDGKWGDKTETAYRKKFLDRNENTVSKSNNDNKFKVTDNNIRNENSIKKFNNKNINDKPKKLMQELINYKIKNPTASQFQSGGYINSSFLPKQNTSNLTNEEMHLLDHYYKNS